MCSYPMALVVSPDPHVRRLIAATLDQIGCVAFDVATGQEGLACAGATRVNLVIVDVSLPNAFETTLIKQLRVGQPDLKVLYLIGGANTAGDHRLVWEAPDAYLCKPFELEQLSDIVASWLRDDIIPLVAAGLSMN
jgi:DNA-binding response OmpR family regulator